MAEIYKINDNVKVEDFLILEENGYFVNTEFKEVVKVVMQPLGGKASNYLLNAFYANPKWKEKHYYPNKKLYKKYYDLKYDKSGNIIITDRIKEIIETWYLYIDFEDGWVGFKNMDDGIQISFHGKKVLDDYCPGEIFTLLSHNLIKVENVEDKIYEVN